MTRTPTTQSGFLREVPPPIDDPDARRLREVAGLAGDKEAA
jgi:hypothetical protein